MAQRGGSAVDIPFVTAVEIGPVDSQLAPSRNHQIWNGRRLLFAAALDTGCQNERRHFVLNQFVRQGF